MPQRKSKLERLTGSTARDIVRWGGVAVGMFIAFKYRTAVAGCETEIWGGIKTNSEQLIGALFAGMCGFGAASVMRAIELKFGKQ